MPHKPAKTTAKSPPRKRKVGKGSHTTKSESAGPQIRLRTGQILQLPPRKKGTENKGLSFTRLFSKKEVHPYNTVTWTRILYKKQGFQREIEAPSHWAYTDVLITGEKYLSGSRGGEPEFEDSLRHAIDRIANTYTLWGWQEGYFKTLEDAEIFNEELKAMQIQQIWAPNSPVWFNIGHFEQWRWGRPDLRARLKGGNKAYSTRATVRNGAETDIETFETSPAQAPQMSACFLTQVEDSMESILGHYLVEGRIFASGSGVGINISTLRSSVEPIAGKGKSSGPVSFDKGYDRSAGGIKSGGRTRRAARMVLLFSDHPDIFNFINAKNDQEEIGKVVLKEHNTLVRLRTIALEKAQTGTPGERLAANAILSLPEVNNIEYSPLMDGLLYGETLTHQNANHSVSLKGDFWKAYKAGGNYSTRWVTDRENIHEIFPASKLMDEICNSAWANAEPGNHNNDWINLWNPVKTDGDITTSNPCCVPGDTLIAVADGRRAVPIKDLVGTEVPVYCYNHANGKTTVRRMHTIEVKRHNAEIYRITLDDGSSFEATDDHKILLKSGHYKMVRDLKEHDSIMPIHVKAMKGEKSRTTRYHYWAGKSWQPQYRAIWKYFRHKFKKGHHIHHEDFNALNDAIDNLKELPDAEHQKLHINAMTGDLNPAKRMMNDTWRHNISAATSGNKNHNFGKKHSDTTRAKMAERAQMRWAKQQERDNAVRAAIKRNKKLKDSNHIFKPKQPRLIKVCQACGQEFQTLHEWRVFCSIGLFII